MNLQYLKHRLAMKVFKAAVFGIVLILALWGMSAEASPGEYEPPPKPTIASVMAKIAGDCVNHQRLVLSVTNPEGRTIYYTFLCQFKFMSDQPPEGDK